QKGETVSSINSQRSSMVNYSTLFFFKKKNSLSLSLSFFHQQKQQRRMETPMRGQLQEKAKAVQHSRHHLAADTRKLHTPLRKQLVSNAEKLHEINVVRFSF